MPLTYLPPLDRDDDDGDDERPPHYVTSEAVFNHAAHLRATLDAAEVPHDDARRDLPRELVAAGNALVRELNASP